MDENTRGLTDRIRQEVRRLELSVGERLGSERELAQRFGTSRGSLRAVLDLLESKGELRRTMGSKGGVFVSDSRIERNLNTILGVPDMLRQQGFSCETTVLRAAVGGASPREQRMLGIPGNANVYRIIRRRDADGIPWSLDSSVIPTELAPDLLSSDLSLSLYGVLKQRFNIEPREASETIEVLPARSYEAKTLGITVGTAVLHITRKTTSNNGQIVEFAHDKFRADRTRVHLRKFGARWKRVLNDA